jgi:hypothetical protein
MGGCELWVTVSFIWWRYLTMKYETATIENFNEVAYLMANPDVAGAVMNGRMASAYLHLCTYGLSEGRMQVVAELSQLDLDRIYMVSDVPASEIASHANHRDLIKSLLQPSFSVLEVGSRCVTSDSMWLREACEQAGSAYLGFDYYPGRNVDVAGDAHHLSSILNNQFDIIYSSAVFEHLAMPWIVSTEINKCLKVGGHLLIETHFSFSSHERPWNFFQFSDMALRVIFPEAMGIDCIEAGMCNPMVGRFSTYADQYLKYRPVIGLYCHSIFYGKKVREVTDFSWKDISLESLVGSARYPAPG